MGSDAQKSEEVWNRMQGSTLERGSWNLEQKIQEDLTG